MNQPDFISIATPLVKRGFRITPVSPLTKQGVMKNWGRKQILTPEEVITFAKYYAHHNVAVVGKRGYNTNDGSKTWRHCFLDDDSGVVQRIEEETGHAIPRTYIVASRPDSNPLKRHFYFTQTEYSFKRFAVFADGGDPWKSRNVNRRDTTAFELSRTGLRQHPTIYDLKGIGGASFVVAAGSMRTDASGRVEIYTCIDDSDVVPLPNWLVDWLVQDIQKYREEKFQEKRRKHARSGGSGLDEYKNSLKHKCLIAEEDVYEFIRWRAGQLTTNIGLSGDGLEHALFHLVRKDCEKGDVFTASEHGKELIHEIVTEAEEWDTGTASPFYLTDKTTSKTLEGHIMIFITPSKREITEEVIRTFPDKITSAEAFEKIEEALFKNGCTYDKEADKSMVYHARKATGFAVQGHLYWIRTPKNGIGVTA